MVETEHYLHRAFTQLQPVARSASPGRHLHAGAPVPPLHEIWIVEKMPFFQPGDGAAYFELWEGGDVIGASVFTMGN